MNHESRHKARMHALQAIYQWQMTQTPTTEINADFIEGGHLHKGTDQKYFSELLTEVVEQHAKLDESFSAFLNIPLENLDPIELTILRIATFELTNRLDIPWKVILDESLELSKNFASIEGYKFVNGVLDKVARELRPTETKAE